MSKLIPALLVLPLVVADTRAAGVAPQDTDAKRSKEQEALSHVKARTAFTDMPGLFRPLDFGQLPDGRYWVCEQDGRLSLFTADADRKVTSFRTVLTLEVNREHNEEGLLDFEPHPNFAENGKFYLHYSIPGDRRGRISEWVLGKDGSIDRSKERVVLEVDQPWRNHNGGQLLFGPDGMLYIGLGDGGSAGDPQENAQDMTSLLGKILRIDVDHRDDDLPYAIPKDNPFVSAEGLPAGTRREIYALGLRNPWRFSFDPSTGALWCGDVGQDQWEMVYKVQRGGNHGWRLREGFAEFEPRSRRGPGPLVDPVTVYPHRLGVSITGGFVYRGKAVPALVGKYVYADFVTNRVWALDVAADEPQPVEFTRVIQPASFGTDLAGELYAVSFGTGNMKRKDGRILVFVQEE
ncbi:MAG: PQQ-dependent sugar dehydrogenase [Planctomycetota bacterium]